MYGAICNLKQKDKRKQVKTYSSKIKSSRSRKWGQMGQKWKNADSKDTKRREKDEKQRHLLQLEASSLLLLLLRFIPAPIVPPVRGTEGSQQLVLIDLITWVVNLRCDCKNSLRSSTPPSARGKGQRRWRATRLIEGGWDLSCLRRKAHINV